MSTYSYYLASGFNIWGFDWGLIGIEIITGFEYYSLYFTVSIKFNRWNDYCNLVKVLELSVLPKRGLLSLAITSRLRGKRLKASFSAWNMHPPKSCVCFQVFDLCSQSQVLSLDETDLKPIFTLQTTVSIPVKAGEFWTLRLNLAKIASFMGICCKILLFEKMGILVGWKIFWLFWN